MNETRIRCFCIDGDNLEVVFEFDKESQKFIGTYPDFELNPRLTKSGLPWVNATQDGCEKALNRYDELKECRDCGSCKHYITQIEYDLIGVCGYSKNEKSTKSMEKG